MQSTVIPIFHEGTLAERSQIPAQSHLASCTDREWWSDSEPLRPMLYWGLWVL